MSNDNKKLVEEIQGLASELKVSVVTEGKSNAELTSELIGLEKEKEVRAAAKKAEEDAKKKTGAEDAADKRAKKEKEKADAAKNKKKPPFYVADGKSITSLRGILGPGVEVKTSYLPGGKKTLDDLIKKDIIKKG